MYKSYLEHFLVQQSDSKVAHKIYIYHNSFMKLEERYIKFENNVVTTISDEQMNKIKFIHPQILGLT